MSEAERPAPEWEPGDPLHRHPRERDYGEGNYVREMFQVLADEETAEHTLLGAGWIAACPHCLVGWGAIDGGPDCWVCGKPAPNYTLAYEREQVRRKEYLNWAALRGGPLDGTTYAGDEPEVVGRIDAVTYYLVFYEDDRAGTWTPYRNGPGWGGKVTDTAVYRRTKHWLPASSRWVFRYEGKEEETDA